MPGIPFRISGQCEFSSTALGTMGWVVYTGTDGYPFSNFTVPTVFVSRCRRICRQNTSTPAHGSASVDPHPFCGLTGTPNTAASCSDSVPLRSRQPSCHKLQIEAHPPAFFTSSVKPCVLAVSRSKLSFVAPWIRPMAALKASSALASSSNTSII